MKTEKLSENPMKVQVFTITDQGTREYQQDAMYAETRGTLAVAVLCDGMGGMNGGEKASNTGVSCFCRDLKEAWPPRNIPEFLEKEAQRLDRVVYALTDEKGNRLNAGSTLVSAIISDNDLYWMSVGDSRLYLVREGKMQCLTAAHNYKTMLQEKLSAGLIDMNYYNAEIKQGEALTSYLGLGNIALIDKNAKPFSLQNEDILLLCSDGLYKTLTDEQIQALVDESGGHLNLAGQRLIETAKRWGRKGQDNTTLILLRVTDRQES